MGEWRGGKQTKEAAVVSAIDPVSKVKLNLFKCSIILYLRVYCLLRIFLLSTNRYVYGLTYYTETV